MNFRFGKIRKIAIVSIASVTVLLCTSLSVTAGLHTEVSPQSNRIFDGIWVNSGNTNVTLIKELNGYVILQGKDDESTWRAQGIINEDRILCYGDGVRDDGRHFVYESALSPENNNLVDRWKAILPDGEELQGKDILSKVDLHQLNSSQIR